MTLRLDQILALLYDPRMLRWIVWGGFAAIALFLLVLMVTRLGQSNPLRKCVLLSVLVHVLLIGYSYMMRLDAFITGPAEQTIMTVVSIEQFSNGAVGEGSDAPPADGAWNRFADSGAPAPAAAEMEPAEFSPAENLDRADFNNASDLPFEASLPATSLSEFESPHPAKMAAADALRPEQAADATDNTDAPTALRRQARAAAAPRQPDLAQEATALPQSSGPQAPRADKQGVPSKLLEQPTLPPQLADAPLADAPAPRMMSKVDRLRGSNRAATDADLGESLGDVSSVGESAMGESAAGELASTRSGRLAAAGGGASVQSLIDGSGIGSEVGGSGSEPAGGAAPPNLLRAGNRAGQGGEPTVPNLYQARTAPNRGAVTAARGGDGETEGAVQAALAWLAAVQSADGRWDADQFGAGREGKVLGRDRKGAGADGDTAVTGLALLAFLGAGQTHQSGEYQDTVRRGLDFLMDAQGRDGNLGGGAAVYAFMYCHGMASFALSEAFVMTQDPRLDRPVRKAIAYTLSAQHPSNGGWRYKPGDPQGDTSQLGWQLMALKSAELGGIKIPSKSREGMVRFLQSVASGPHDGLASYRPKEKVSRTMTAEALVCRQFLGMSRANPASDEAGDYILRELPGDGEANFYYWYYGTLATFHLQGEHWQAWNDALKETLLRLQRTEGDESGSWDPDTVWGKHGGRIYSTALGALCLEVYYRYLPLYSEAPRPERLK